MDEWYFKILMDLLNITFDGATQTCKCEETKTEKERMSDRHYEIVPGGTLIRTTTLSLIQEGEFTEIEDAESGETSVGELADQTADRREEILRDETDESGVQGGSEETVCGLRDREEEPNDSRGSD